MNDESLRKRIMNDETGTRACVIGWPVEHSRSPLIHGYWLRRYGVAGRYDRRAVQPEELEDFLLGLAGEGLRGCNVTIPHKERAWEIISEANPEGIGRMGNRLKAVNTVWLDEVGRLHADNTDVHGFMANFHDRLGDWKGTGQHVVVLGAGGAARAVIAGFVDVGVRNVTVVNRTVEKAEKMAEELGEPVRALPLEKLGEVMPEADVFVNATSLGMTGQPSLDLDLSPLPDDAVVADIVYVPLETDLLKRARQRGLRTVDGLGMLLHQAVPGFEKWFGVRPDVTPELRRLVEADLAS